MGNPAREGADRFQSLCVLQSLFERLPFGLRALALNCIRENLARRTQENDVVVLPSKFGEGSLEAAKSDALAGRPHRNAEPRSDAPAFQIDLLRAARQCPNARNMKAAVALVPRGVPILHNRQAVWESAARRGNIAAAPVVLLGNITRIPQEDDRGALNLRVAA